MVEQIELFKKKLAYTTILTFIVVTGLFIGGIMYVNYEKKIEINDLTQKNKQLFIQLQEQKNIIASTETYQQKVTKVVRTSQALVESLDKFASIEYADEKQAELAKSVIVELILTLETQSYEASEHYKNNNAELQKLSVNYYWQREIEDQLILIKQYKKIFQI